MGITRILLMLIGITCINLGMLFCIHFDNMVVSTILEVIGGALIGYLTVT